MDHTPHVHLPMVGGTKGVFCEMSYRRTRPCNGRVTLSNNGTVMTGYVVYSRRSAPQAVYLCTPKCLEAFARKEALR
jgi:hypothetical protein